MSQWAAKPLRTMSIPSGYLYESFAFIGRQPFAVPHAVSAWNFEVLAVAMSFCGAVCLVYWGVGVLELSRHRPFNSSLNPTY